MALLSVVFGACDRFRNSCVIEVGDTCINKSMFKERMAGFAEESLIDSEEILKQMMPVLANNIIEEQLILNYAKKENMYVTEEEIDIALGGLTQGIGTQDLENLLTEEYRNVNDMRGYLRKRLYMNKALDRAVRKEIVISSEVIKEYYETHESEFYRPASVELYHVFVQDHFQAKEALVMLRSGIGLEQVVSRYSDSKDMNDSGFMGVFVKGDLPKEVEDVVFSIPPQRYSGIIETQRGYHIFYVAKRTKPGTLPLIDAADEIREKLAEEVFERKYAEFINKLKQEYTVKVDWDEINALSVKE